MKIIMYTWGIVSKDYRTGVSSVCLEKCQMKVHHTLYNALEEMESTLASITEYFGADRETNRVRSTADIKKDGTYIIPSMNSALVVDAKIITTPGLFFNYKETQITKLFKFTATRLYRDAYSEIYEEDEYPGSAYMAVYANEAISYLRRNINTSVRELNELFPDSFVRLKTYLDESILV